MSAELSAKLATFIDPFLQQPWQTLASSLNLQAKDGVLEVAVSLPYPAQAQQGLLSQQLQQWLGQPVRLQTTLVLPASQSKIAALPGVKHVVAVASGKGGVGKSTTTVNLALAMASLGARVGILDADIYGPSQGMMLGIAEGTRPQPLSETLMAPLQAHGLQAMSMAFLVDTRQPMVWRGPMASGALQQLINQTAWDDLDVLFVDMPPGTGDIQLTLAQRMPVSGAVIVTTPQDIALLDAQKGVEMFRKVQIPVLGVVENMSLHRCSACGHSEAIFGAGGGERIAADYQTQLLGQLPLTLKIRQQADSGKPTVIAEPEGEEAAIYRDIAFKLTLALYQQAGQQSLPSFEVSDD
ncbi:iron-sulfur cluster carrier protein ApbC [Balneatrix alpica]|uniref:Iron-sulfur cluster carrier protein n=1 Tax=Balneatrix alpica TaxID=75684 RepID=A0ABV5Z8K7_9GAMM|nr:iron-sulfur cluster carrier protein ApbC [Balneatrix alpica]